MITGNFIDISISQDWPSCALSNMAAHDFVFDGVVCASMEGLLQSFKFKDQAKQLAMTDLTGLDAKYGGKPGDGWRKHQMLYWKGDEYGRQSAAYQMLLNRAYAALANSNQDFQKALLATGLAYLTHRVGNPDATVTILTPTEFTTRLMNLRGVIRSRLST